MTYLVRRTPAPPSLADELDEGAWGKAPELRVASYRPESSAHRPVTRAKLLYDVTSLYVQFRVHDRYVRCVNGGFGGPVWEDSCVEFFFQPAGVKGYFNLEMNCGGAFTCSYVEDPTRTGSGFARSTRLTEEQARRIGLRSSIPGVLREELPGPVAWSVSAAIPLSVVEAYAGPVGDPGGQSWRGNFFKCADRCSHPHWGSWASVGDLDFHRPQDFGTLQFEAPPTVTHGPSSAPSR